ncbi:MAG TPA: (2Fe-2S)-binding protein [Terracidiphilus sp.]|jgi:predicted molibdopterin-dependent oxidoreductase YjgC|nr:(2Fe-2S)-binding protein [Terracidiphilus sp.]
MDASTEIEATATIGLTVNGERVRVRAGTTVAAAMLSRGAPCRTSLCGEPRAPLCGMGICMECRASVDGKLHARTCQTLAREGMEIVTG